MKISIMSPYPDITNYGVRSLSSVLKREGFSTQLLFMPDFSGDGESSHSTKSEQRYSPAVIEHFLALVKDSALIGISLMTHYFDSAKQITLAVKARYPEKLVIWGGFHASVRPDECMRFADYVAVGDAEHLLVQLARRIEAGDTQDLKDIKSLIWKRGDVVVRNPIGTLEQDLDLYPPPDFDMNDHWYLLDDELLPGDADLLERFLNNGTISTMFGMTGYQTMTGRGCPHACTYCGNSFYRSLYKRQRYVRYRSVEHVIRELEDIKRRFPFINFFWFSDDSFFGRPLPDIQRFAREYKARIGDPFYLLGSPGTITDEKYAPLVDAGLLCLQMGIEHGSPRIQKMFNRATMGNRKVIRTANILAKYKDRTAPPQYDLVYDLAYETMEDKLATLALISELPKPYKLQVFSIIYYPGTSLHTLAKRDGLIQDEKAEIYDRMYSERHDSYTNTLLFLARSGHFPHPLLKFLIRREVADAMTSDYMKPAGAVTLKALDAFRAVFRNPAIQRAKTLGFGTGKEQQKKDKLDKAATPPPRQTW